MATQPHDTKTETAAPHAAPKAAAGAVPKDTGADQLKLLLFLAADWLNNDRTHQAEVAALVAAITNAAGPPVNVDIPFVTQSGAQLTCTMGNWKGEPSSYAYAWYADGVADAAATAATRPVKPEDAGRGFGCVVTAANPLGSTAAPMSNVVVAA